VTPEACVPSILSYLSLVVEYLMATMTAFDLLGLKDSVPVSLLSQEARFVRKLAKKWNVELDAPCAAT
jgi:hypothetical protein